MLHSDNIDSPNYRGSNAGLKYDYRYRLWCLNRKIRDKLLISELSISNCFSKRVSDLRLKTISFQSTIEAGHIK